MRPRLLLPAFIMFTFLYARASVSITTTTLPDGTVNSSYSGVIAASGGCTPYAWKLVSGTLPPGVTDKGSSNTTSIDLTGTPTTAGTYSFTVSVTGCGKHVSTMAYKVTIQASTEESVSITTTALPNGTVNSSYSGVIAASGGCTPYAWKLASGTLPPGLTDKASTNTTSLGLTGKPTTAGTYSFTVSVMGCGRHISEESYKVTIQASANHVVDLSWKASTSSGISGYNVYRSPDDATWKKLNASLVASTLYDDSTVSNGSTYYYTVTAVDLAGKESSGASPIKVVIP